MEVKGHRHAKELLLRQAHARDHRVVRGLVHEAGEGAERTVEKAEHVAGLALIQLYGSHGGLRQCLDLCGVLDHEVLKSTPMRGTSRCRPGVDATLGLCLAHKTASALTFVGVDWHCGMRVAKRLEDVSDGRWRCSF